MTWKELKAVLATGCHVYDPDLLEKSPLGLKRYAAIARDYRRKNGFLLGAGRTRDGAPAFNFRMPAATPGTPNRFHPLSIEPCLIDVNAPPTVYGNGVVIDPTTQGVRPLVAGDQALTDVYGITVRPFPLQQNSVAPGFGAGTPPVSGVIGVLRNGYIAIGFNASGSAPVKGGAVYIWTAATSGAHLQGGWETANPAGSGCAVGTPPRTTYQGGWDATNFGELAFHV